MLWQRGEEISVAGLLEMLLGGVFQQIVIFYGEYGILPKR
jgi:hypothetical protein